MGRKRPERTERRQRARAVHKLIHGRERLAAMTQGGSPQRPINVKSAAVIEPRARAIACPQCAGECVTEDHRAEAGLRAVRVRCRQCQVARTLWFTLSSSEPN
jgi:hypothetical protein